MNERDYVVIWVSVIASNGRTPPADSQYRKWEKMWLYDELLIAYELNISQIYDKITDVNFVNKAIFRTKTLTKT